MPYFNKKALVALILGVIALPTFFIDSYLYKPFWIDDFILLFFTIPLIIVSLVLNIVATVQDLKNKKNVWFQIVVFIIYITFLVIYYNLLLLSLK